VIYGVAEVFDYQARAFGELGNALRAQDELWEAQKHLGEAFKLLEKGTGDPMLKARLHDFHASLLGTQRKFNLALNSLDIVYWLYQEIGDFHRAGRVLTKKAMYTYYSGSPLEAIRLNEQAMQLIDGSREHTLPATALLNHLVFLEACGKIGDAKRLLFDKRREIEQAGEVVRFKLRWTEARIQLLAQKFVAAEEGFRQAREFFLGTGQGFAAALVSLELALVLMRQGRFIETREIATEAAAMFLALDIHREVLGAVQLLADAFRLEKASLELVERTVAFIREWEHNPEARFLPETE
jgi:tetratricopeptide (TPR) repeat protein